MLCGHLPPQQVKHFTVSIPWTNILGGGVKGHLNFFGIGEVDGFRDPDDQKAVSVPLNNRLPFARCRAELRRQIQVAE